MPELRDKQLPNFTPAGPEVDIHAISFKDKTREAARQKRLAAELAAGGKNAKQILDQLEQTVSIGKATKSSVSDLKKDLESKLKIKYIMSDTFIGPLLESRCFF